MRGFRTINRYFRDAFHGVFRNFSLSLASISCITITLIVVAFSLLLSMNVENFSESIRKDVTVVMFLKSDTTAEDVSKIKKELEGVSNIENSTIEFKSKADSALELKNGNDIFATTVDKWTDDTNPLLDSYMFMVKEIEESYRDLAVVPSAADWGHFTQGAALTLLMKIYMGAKQFDKVNQVADEIIGLGTYELLPDYKAVFDINNEGVTHKEAIFVIGQTTSNAKYAWTWFACVMPSSPLYAGTYLKTIWGGLKMPWTFYDKYEEQDKRLETIVRYYTDTDGNKVDYRQVDHPKATGAAPMKYSEDPEQKGERQSNDFIMFRYADVLLAKAEAMNELNGPSEEAIEWVNQIRRRANATEIKLVDFNKDTFRDFILDERGRELYCEGHRRDDLIRHGKYIEYARKDGMDAKDYHILFPIPQKALNENSNLKQNPGYEN